MARVNYQRDKRLKDLARQSKQEEKRLRKLQKDQDPDAPLDPLAEPAAEDTTTPDQVVAE